MQKTSIIFLLFSMFSLETYGNTNPEDTLPKVPLPLINPSNKIDVEEAPKAPNSQLEKILSRTVEIKTFKLNGLTAIPEAEVRSLLDPEIGKTLSVKDIIELTKKVTQIYVKNGYALSYAYLPNQPFPTNEIVINFNEGYVENLTLQGDYTEIHEKIRAIIAPILKERPLTKKTLERQNGMLTLLSGAEVRASLPIPKQGNQATNLTIAVNKREHTYSANFESISPRARGVATFRTASQTANAEQFLFSTLLSAQDEEYYAVSYSQLVGNSGLGLKIDGSMYDGDNVLSSSQNLNRNAFSLRLSTSITYPLILSKSKSLLLTSGVTASNFEDKVTIAGTFRSLTQKTNSRALNVGLNYASLESNQSSRLNLLLTKGLDSLDASKSVSLSFNAASLVNPDDLDFTKLSINLNRADIFDSNIGTSVSISGQKSNDRLPVVEKIQFGGYQYGRAYAPGFLFGDSGYGVALEVNKLYPLFYKISSLNILAVQPYALYETARTYSNFNNIPDAFLNSFAIGARFRTEKTGTIDFSIAKPMSSKVSNVEEPNGLRFSLNYGLIFN